MQHNILREAGLHIKRHRRRRIWKKIVQVMACVVVFCTTYALILPAITMEQQTFCGCEEHTHITACYRQLESTGTLSCSPTSLGVHTHSDGCFDDSGNVTCGQADYIAHSHAERCYDAAGMLICSFPEAAVHEHGDDCFAFTDTEGHVHSEACYTIQQGELLCITLEGEGHTHADTCYEMQQTCTIPEGEGHSHQEGCYGSQLTCEVTETDGHYHGDSCYITDLICGQEEQSAHTHGPECNSQVVVCGLAEVPAHTHDEGCYAEEKILSCGQEETDAEETELICTIPQAQTHTHTDACMQVEADNSLTCTLPEDETHIHGTTCYGNWERICLLEEHAHSLPCFSDPEADVETAEVWERTFADVELTGVWADDVIAIAETQIGYTESTRNYTVWEDGTVHGYTRYGDWFGSPHGDWCAMFVSFCLNYADVKGVPLNWGCRTWIEELSKEELDLYRVAEEYTPKPGDIVFFDWEQADETSDDLSDHVGLVAELIPATEEEPAKLRIIEGDSSDQVKYNTYDMDDPQLLGYGMMPENPELEEEPVTEETVPAETVALPYTFSDDTVYVEVELPEDTDVPGDAVLTVKAIDSDDAGYEAFLQKAETAVGGAVTNIALYDISFYTADGNYIPVDDTAKVTMGFVDSPVDLDANVQLLHFKEAEEEPQQIHTFSLEEKPLEMILESVQQAPAPTAQILEQQSQISLFSGTVLSEAPALEAAQPFGLLKQEDTVQEEQSGEETTSVEEQPEEIQETPSIETVTESRTVIEFTTDGFSVFAVVEVDVNAGESFAAINEIGNLNGKRIIIAGVNYNIENGKSPYAPVMTSIPVNITDDGVGPDGTELKPGFDYRTSGGITVDGNNALSITLNNTVNALWQFTAVANKTNTYYIQPVGSNQYLNIAQNSLTLGDQQEIVIQNAETGNDNIKNAVCLTSGGYAVNLNKGTSERPFTGYGNDPANDGNHLVLFAYPDEELPVTNLDGKSLAIVNARANQAVTGTVENVDNKNQLVGESIAWVGNNNAQVHVPNDKDADVSWTFTAVDAAQGIYNIQNDQGYLTIGDGTAIVSAEPQNITVFSAVRDGKEIIGLKSGNVYLNDYGGNKFDSFSGYDEGPDDPGSCFLLAVQAKFTAEVISRDELRRVGTWPGNKLVFFVRQRDAAGNDRYYAVNEDGQAIEIFLEEGATLADGARIYSTAASVNSMLWDATGSATSGWGSAEYENDTRINLQYKNVATGTYLLPNVVGGTNNITSPDNPAENRPLYWGERPSPVIAVTAPAGVTIDTSIAHMVLAAPSQNIDGVDEDNRTKRLTYEPQTGSFGVEKVVNVNGPKVADADQRNVFYIASIIMPIEVEDVSTSHDTVVSKILTRHEIHDAALMDEAKFILFTKQTVNGADHYYALDSYGNAIELDMMDTNAVGGQRFVLPGSQNYNTDRILWDPSPTALDNAAANDPNDGGFVDLWLRNEATGRMLSPTAGTGVGAIVGDNNPLEVDHAPGFYGYEETGGLNTRKVTTLLGASNDGKTGDLVKYDTETGTYIVQNNTFASIGKDANEFVFYVALVVDRGVTYNADTNKVAEYEVVPGVKENVQMWLFNYGSSIDYYGQNQNNTADRAYRFFHRPAFSGQAIDGTNEDQNEYADGDPIKTFTMGTALDNGYPYFTSTYASHFSLQYLFDKTAGFNNTAAQAQTLYQTGTGGWAVIPANDTAVNQNGGTTSVATAYDPVMNPNYSVQAFQIENTGEGTGLFQIDDTTGNYYYDSACNAAYFNGSKMELYDYALLPGGSLWPIGGNFLPFNQGHTQGRLIPTDAGWQGNHDYVINDRTYQLNGIHHDNDPVIGRGSMTDLWFGMYMEIDFTMSKDGKIIPVDSQGNIIGNGTPIDMIFDFTGDDDVLVYIDDVLCLDISGIHGAEDGNINFATGIADSPGMRNKPFSDLFAPEDLENGKLKPWTQHTLKFYFMERGGNISNCRISYNLVEIPIGSMSVTKEVEGVNPGTNYIGEYRFQLSNVQLGDKNAGQDYLYYYTVTDAAGQPVSGKENIKIDESDLEGFTFTLQANQTAYFHGLPERTKMRVTELTQSQGQAIRAVAMAIGDEDTDASVEQTNWYQDITVDSVNPENCRVTCVNTLDDVDLQISKRVAGPVDRNTQFKIRYTITKPDGTQLSDEVNLMADQTHTVENVPFGSVLDVQEVEADGYNVEWKYTVVNPPDDTILGTDSGSGAELTGIPLLGNMQVEFENSKPTYATVAKTVIGTVTQTAFPFAYETATEGNFSLKDGESYRIDNIPLGSSLQVTETNSAGYTTTYEVYSRYEAEAGTGNTGEIRTANAATHSGGAFVGDWDKGKSATYTFNSPVSGNVTMRIYGCSAENRALVVTINGTALNVATASTGSWDTTNGSVLATVTIPVVKGLNTMVVGGPAAAYAPNVDCFDIVWAQSGGTSCSLANIQDPIVIHFTNTAGYELPKTGGAGTYLYTMSGLMLMLASALLLYSKKRRGKEDFASS